MTTSTREQFDHALERVVAAEECLRRLMIIISSHLPATGSDMQDLFEEYQRVVLEIEKEATP